MKTLTTPRLIAFACDMSAIIDAAVGAGEDLDPSTGREWSWLRYARTVEGQARAALRKRIREEIYS